MMRFFFGVLASSALTIIGGRSATRKHQGGHELSLCLSRKHTVSSSHEKFTCRVLMEKKMPQVLPKHCEVGVKGVISAEARLLQDPAAVPKVRGFRV